MAFWNVGWRFGTPSLAFWKCGGALGTPTLEGLLEVFARNESLKSLLMLIYQLASKYVNCLNLLPLGALMYLLVDFRPKVWRKSPRKAKKNKRSKENGQKAKKEPNPASTARLHPPFLNMEVFIGGAPARPRWCAHATPFRNAQDKDLARPRGDGRTHLNEG
ncbi:hypothetical protein PIB30_030497 [Stylosanthes scabra]|uniref:Uncharacterized protein n=1 Tax=Stylosanthes scabra TaxID=79078 RepID=A0ABU6WBC1_9FABA|nr:hypothetical protein [Stylosanthes scabra]